MTRSVYILLGGTLAAFVILGVLAVTARAAPPKVAAIERHGWRCVPGHGWWHYAYGWHSRPSPRCGRRWRLQRGW